MIIASGAGAQYTGPVEVETAEFGQDTFSIGSLSPAEGALPRNLWQGANAGDIALLLDNAPARFAHPAQAEIFRRVMLSPGNGPANAPESLTGKKLMALARAGFYEEAASLAELAGGLSTRPGLAESVAYADMMRGDMNAACRRGANLQSGRNSPFWLKLRFICYTVSGETAAADLTLGLLREQSLLSAEEDALFVGLATGTRPTGNIQPGTGFQYAAVRQLQMPLDLNRLDAVDGAVLVALANDTSAPQEARVFAAERAARFGLISGERLGAIFASLQFPPDRLQSAGLLLREQPGNVLVDALAWQAVTQLSAPEMALDRADLVARALGAADDMDRFLALAQLYAPMISQFDVVANFAPHAREFALVGIMTDRQEIAGKWLTALATDTTQANGIEQAIELLQLWSLRDEFRAKSIGNFAGLTITPPMVEETAFTQSSGTADAALIPELVRISLASRDTVPTGQAALVALLASTVSASAELESVRQIIQTGNLQSAGLSDINKDQAFLSRAALLFGDTQRPAAPTAPRSAVSETGEPSAEIRPRIKPPVDG